MRAILLASATRTSIGGLRAIIRASHEPAGAPLRAARIKIVFAPIISRRRSVRSPIFEVAPSVCLPPVERCKGVSPTQAAKSRPRLKVSAGGAGAARATAITGPTPGMVAMRRLILLGPLGDLTIQTGDLLVQASERLDQHLEDGSGELWDRLGRILDSPHELRNTSWAFGHDEPELGQVPPQGIDDLSSLFHQEITGSEHNRRRLSLLTLGRHEAHGRALRRLADRLGIGRIALLPLNKGLDVSR
jgi:hypothetical protein